jgi:hypothetical protein
MTRGTYISIFKKVFYSCYRNRRCSLLLSRKIYTPLHFLDEHEQKAYVYMENVDATFHFKLVDLLITLSIKDFIHQLVDLQL